MTASTGRGRAARDRPPDPEVAGVRLTHPDRVLYPERRITKLGVARFYEAIADWILPHVVDRPLSVLRCPEGRGKTCFLQRHAGPGGMPEHVRPVNAGGRPYFYVEDLAGLISLVQMGGLEFHPWGARVELLEQPDRMVLDLDPSPGLAWTRVTEAARRLRGLLAEFGLTAFVKTTGGKGLHVVVPVRCPSWTALRGGARALAEEAARRWPDEYTARLSKSSRTGKIFIDYLRNARTATAVAAYSTRARAGAPVATPLAWAELGPNLRSDRFTVESLPSRLASLRRDPWADYFTTRQALPATLAGRRDGAGGRPAPSRARRPPASSGR